MIKNFLFFFLCIILSINGWSQTISSTDQDSSKLTADTLSIAPPSGALETTVVYAAQDSIIFSFKTKRMQLFGSSEIDYGTLNLKSATVDIDWNQNLLHAIGLPDSAGKIVGQPAFVDQGEAYDGTQVYYNFKTKKGRVVGAKTEIADGYYRGETIKKMDGEILYVENGIYTTCNAEQPHFHFWGKEMKIIVHDKVIARPVLLEISHVPIIGLPFAILPNRSGRQSGLLPPSYGESVDRGVFLSGLGYYWALSDYTDLTIRTDLYSKSGYNIESGFNYTKRYDFSGRLDGGFSRTWFGETTDPDYRESEDYRIYWNHRQQIDPTSAFNANLSFQSGNYFQRTSFNPSDLVTQQIASDASYSKQFEETPWSMNVGYSRRQNLITGTYSENLPSLSLNRRTTNPFRDENTPQSQQSWYERIALSYSFSFLKQNSKSLPIPNGSFLYDSKLGAQHNPGITIPFPVAKYFTVSPSFSYSEKWYWETVRKSLNPTTNLIETNRVQGFSAARSFSTGIGASTRIYGIVQPQWGRVTGFRHVMQPSVSYSYTPDFSDPSWGYYKDVQDSLGRVQTYSIYEQGIYGGPGKGRISSLNMNLGNSFEMKLAGVPDENGKKQKDEVVSLLRSLNFSIGYNFAADSLNWSNLSISANNSIGSNFSINYNSSYTLYDFVPITSTAGTTFYRQTKHTLYDKDKGFLRSLFQSLNFNFSYQGQRSENTNRLDYSDQLKAKENPFEDANLVEQRNRQLRNVDFDVPWNMSLNASFTWSTPTPDIETKSAFMSGSVDFSLTPNWKFFMDGGYDLINKQFATPRLTVARDLHCWQMDFSWIPDGRYSFYRLSIHVKAPNLQDIAIKLDDVYYNNF